MQVVDGLETVQVDEGHGQRMPLALATCHGLLQAVGQQHPVGQAGQRVVVRNAFELALVFLDGGDVGEERHIVRCCTQRGLRTALMVMISANSSPFFRRFHTSPVQCPCSVRLCHMEA